MLRIERVDYLDPIQMADLLMLLDRYAQDPMGGAEPLSTECRQNLSGALQQCPTAISLIAYQNGQPAGLLNAFQSVSSIATALLQHIEEIAREQGCCKLTLEVLSGNQTAQRTYLRNGFAGYELDPAQGHALFWQKKLC